MICDIKLSSMDDKMKGKYMAITDKTRKILWAKSGKRCAICKQN